MLYQRRNSSFSRVNGCYKTNMSLRLVTVPEFPCKLLTGENNFAVTCSSILDPPQEIINYHFSIPELGLTDLESTDGNFTLNIEPNYSGKQLLVSDLYAVDCLLNRSRIVTVYTQITDSYIKAPVILAPVNNATIYSVDFPIVGDEFVLLGNSNNEMHISTDIKITRDVDGLRIVYKKYGYAQKGSLETFVFNQRLNSGQYYIFIRYKGNKLNSTWSKPVKINYQLIR